MSKEEEEEEEGRTITQVGTKSPACQDYCAQTCYPENALIVLRNRTLPPPIFGVLRLY